MEPRVLEKIHKHHRRQRRQKGYVWFSRLRLFDEAQARGKAVDALTDEEFDHALRSIDRYYKMNPAYTTQWALQERRGPQSSAERHERQKVNYLGTPRRYKFFSRMIFDRELTALREGATLDDVT